MALKNNWANGDTFTPAAANDMANAVNAATGVTVDGSSVSSYDIDPTPLTASDVDAYTRDEVDEAIDAAKDRTELVRPRINSIHDTNSNEVLRLGPQANAVNLVQISNGSGGNGPAFDAVGTGTNLSFTFVPKGSGGINYYLGTGQTSGRLFVSGTAPNIDINLQTQGTGTVQANSVPVVTTTGTQTLTNKSLTSPAITTPTGIVKGDVGLGNVDNTSNATERAASATLTNKTLTTPRISGALTDVNGASILYMDPKTTSVNYLVVANGATGNAPALSVYGPATDVSLNLKSQNAGTVQANGVPVVTTTGTQTLTNKSLTSPAITTPTGIVKGDVGLGSVDNTADAAKAVLSATKLTTARTIAGVSFDGTANINPVTAATVGGHWSPSPSYVSNNYYFCNHPNNIATSAVSGNGTMRVTPWTVVSSVTINALFAEFTAAGDAASVIRLGVWADDGNYRPSTLLLDAGTISTGTGNAGTVATGGTAGVYAITGLSLALTPGVYWVGGGVQGVTVTQPTIRTVLAASGYWPAHLLPLGTSLPFAGANGYQGYSVSSVTGSLSNFPGSPTVGLSGTIRVGFRAA